MFSRDFFATVTLVFLINTVLGYSETAKSEEVEKNDGRLFSMIEDKLEIRVGEYVNYATKWLEGFNDRHLGASELGRLLHYEKIKPTLDVETVRSKSAGRMKKMSMAMMPLIFHVGATSTWMILTSIMAAKSVAIGLALLIFKIAVSSAKLASFFTLLKGKHADHHGWGWSPPHHGYEHHGHDRSFTEIGHSVPSSPPSDWHSYSPEWTPHDVQEYHTIPAYKTDDEGYLTEDRKKADRKKFTR